MLVIYGCIANYSKFGGLNNIYHLTISVGQESRCGLAGPLAWVSHRLHPVVSWGCGLISSLDWGGPASNLAQ